MSKKNAPFVPPLPRVDPPSQETMEYLRNLTKKERKQLKKSIDANLQPIRELKKQQKRKERSDWWWSKGLLIINTILALIAAVTGIIAIMR